MYKMISAAMAGLMLALVPAFAEEPERDTLYLVTTLQAAPGDLAGMIDDLQALAEDGYYRDAGRADPWILRHSQGDHWDLMLVEPVGNYVDFFAGERLEAAGESETVHKARLGSFDDRTSFREEVFAWGPSPDVMGDDFDTAGLYHIEMFRSLPGALGALIEQREMENAYLEATGQVTNWIFVSSLGSDIDAFTIGTHESLQSFAQSPDLTPEEFEAAATDAGFESRGTIGFYLRSLISGHNDTLATPVR
jgi:hypothetical protein